MGLSSSKPFQIFLSDIFEKVPCYSACCGGQVIVEDHCEFEESTDKESERYSGKILTLLIKLCLLLYLGEILYISFLITILILRVQ